MRDAHTPGPWMVDDEQEDKHHLYVRHVGSGRICQCFANCLVTTDAAVLANARLIAAAPDLLDALHTMVGKACKQNWNDKYPDELAQAFAAIAKATGGQS